jgi:hypothetical protein
MQAIADLFWAQIEWMRPDSYLGDGDRCLVFVSSDHELFGGVREILNGSRSQNAG